jgi:hypothetical protein
MLNREGVACLLFVDARMAITGIYGTGEGRREFSYKSMVWKAQISELECQGN